MSYTDHFAILPEASGLRIISSNGNDETTVTGWTSKYCRSLHRAGTTAYSSF
jgi:hypothetical protein